MKVKELMEVLATLPGDAEVLCHETGDPTVGIWDCSYGIKRVDWDAHEYAADALAAEWCSLCGVPKEDHVSAPTLIWMEVDA